MIVNNLEYQYRVCGDFRGHDFRYDPYSGDLFKFHQSKKEWYKCSLTLSQQGYRRVKVNGKGINQHRIIFFLMEGRLPEMIDHIDGNTSNNKWYNLRECSNRDNQGNQSKHREGRLPGTSYKPWGKWIAQISIEGTKLHLGSFDSEKEAHEAYLEARRIYGF